MSETDILNNALIYMGVQTVLAADNTTPQGRRFANVYPMQRDALLRAHYWNFAIKRTSLAALSTTPDWGYTLQYQLPSDCLGILQVNDYAGQPAIGYYNQLDNSPYKIESGMILTDYPAPLKIRYLSRVTDTSQFDTCFTEMLSLKIAAVLVEDLKNNTQMVGNIMEMYQDSLKRALRGNAIEKAQQGMVDGDIIVSRI